MKRKVKIALIARIDMRDGVGMVGYGRAAATFDAEVDWLPMEPGDVVVGKIPHVFDEVLWQDEESGESVRQFLR